MKVKQYVVITDPERFLKGDMSCFTLLPNTNYLPKDWTVFDTVEFAVYSSEHAELLQKATAELDADMGKLEAAMNVLEQRKRELLAITHQPEPVPQYEKDHPEEYSDEKILSDEESLDEIAARELRAFNSLERG